MHGSLKMLGTFTVENKVMWQQILAIQNHLDMLLLDSVTFMGLQNTGNLLLQYYFAYVFTYLVYNVLYPMILH